ncbi:MAG: hypothetical protein N2248_05180 [candidate division WOR-3 bacterium]|uniref:Tetratricopeptide repeat protein n=1 Tax=candidate division WOR-3 bacterium TaxID=2052148 RepID=A0A7C1NLU4_UNCW3|nr:hypothetical protein [candidate division WOR-3 bacterium]
MKQLQKRKKGFIARNPWLWTGIGIVVIIALLFLARTLSQPPPQKTDTSRVALKKQNLDAYTLMAGTIQFDTALFTPLAPDLRRQMQQLLRMVSNRELADVIARLNRMRRHSAYESGVIRLLTGVCYYELGQAESALNAFRSGVKLLDTLSTPDEYHRRLIARLGFNCGYLFQFYSYPESARHYYTLSQRALSSLAEPDRQFAGSLLNNLGLTLETIGDTVNAQRSYLQALNYLDTTGTTPEAARLQKNLRRNFRASRAGQHQS